MNYAVYLKGGLGDILLGLLREGQPAGYISALRALDPQAHITARAMCTSRAAADELLADCGLFDEVDVRQWDGVGHLDDSLPTVPKAGAWQRPPLCRLPRCWRNRVVFHPFAGTPDRDWRASFTQRYVPAGALTLGGSAERLDGRSEVRRSWLHEWWGVESGGRDNIMLNLPAVFQAQAAAECKAFVGAFSAFHCAAFAAGRPAYVVAPKELQPFIEKTDHPVYGRLSERPGARFDYFSDRSEGEQMARIAEWLELLL